ncbi:MAG: glycosyltransferase family 39 protein [Chloroflexi bacterium]|nr:glycosyltransferase family 39 protein [Chloroflexota bacterium]
MTLPRPAQAGFVPDVAGRRRATLLTLAAITLAAFFLRYWQLTTLPPGYWFDEGHKSLVALEIVRGLRAPIYVTDYDGIEAGFFWLLAGWFKLFGPGYYGARALSALLGALTVPTTFWSARQLYRQHPRAEIVGLISAGVLSVLLWHVHWSRLGLETISVPLFAIATLGLVAWAWHHKTWPAFALAGAALGLSQYTNPGARVLPLQALLVFFILADRRLASIFKFGSIFFVAALLVYAPLGLFFWQNPQWFLARIAFTSVGARAGGLPVYVDNLFKTLLSFNFQGDPRPRHNLAGRPAFDWVTSIWMWLGVLTALRARAHWRSHLAVFVALAVNTIPMILSDGAPGFGRTLGLAPILVILPALGVTASLEWAGNRRPLWAAVILSLAFSAGLNIFDYFGRYPKQPGLFEAFEVGLHQMTQAAAQAETGYLMLDEAALNHPGTRLARELSSNDLRLINGQTCFAYPARATRETTFATLPKWIPSILAQYPAATQTDILHEPEAYQHAALLEVPAGQVSLSGAGEALARFGDQFELLALQPTSEAASPGEPVSILFRWRDIAPSEIPYTVFAHLVSASQPFITGVDGEPCAGWYPTSQWHAGEVVEHRLTLTLPADLPSGSYDLMVGMYDWTTGERLPVSQPGQREPDRAIAGTIVIK